MLSRLLGRRVENGRVGEERGVVLYGCEVDAVAEALRELDPRFVPADRAAPGSGQLPVLCCSTGTDADAVREMRPGVAWMVVELYRPGVDVGRAREPRLWLNTSKIDPSAAARAISQPDVVIWYEVINPIRAVTVGGGPVADDYSNVRLVVPDGHRMVAHAVCADGAPPECLPGGAERVLRSDDLWALAHLRGTEMCLACTLRHG